LSRTARRIARLVFSHIPNSLLQQFSKVHLQHVRHAQQGIKGGIVRLAFQAADGGLVQPGQVSHGIPGKATALPLVHQQADEFKGDAAAALGFRHAAINTRQNA
jgi:hypothetical protein